MKTKIYDNIFYSFMQALNSLLNKSGLSHCFRHKTTLALITIALLMFFGCGKRKPPLPPVERVQQRVEINGQQQGNQVVLSWSMPARNAPDGSILNINRIDIYRLIEPLSSPLSLSEEDFSSRSTLIASVPVSEDDFGLKNLTYTDKLEFAGQASRIRYAIRFVNSSGQKAAFSDFLLFEPSARIAENPKNLTVEVSQEKVDLRWEAPERNVDASVPPNILGYNIYRSSSENENFRILNKQPVTKNSFEDMFFEFEKNYRYLVRAVSVGSGGQPVESLDSNVVEIAPIDKFPPSPPSAITIAASPGVISLFFAVNPEKDIVGYNVYRSTEENLPKADWQLLNTELLKTNTFRDAKVESGTKYFYYLTAVDKFGNASEPSAVVSETAF